MPTRADTKALCVGPPACSAIGSQRLAKYVSQDGTAGQVRVNYAGQYNRFHSILFCSQLGLLTGLVRQFFLFYLVQVNWFVAMKTVQLNWFSYRLQTYWLRVKWFGEAKKLGVL